MQNPTTLSLETRRLLSLAWPVMLTSMNWTILHVTDVVVVGFVSTHEVAALGASRTLTYPGIVMAIGALSGILVFASRADGAGDLKATGRTLHNGLVLGLFLGLIAAAILFFGAEPLLRALGVTEMLVADTAAIVRMMAIAYPFQMVIVATSFFLEGVSRPRRITVVNLSILPINAVLAWALAGGHWGLPMLGGLGAALATTIASMIGAIGMVIAAWTLPGAKARGVHALETLFNRSSLIGALSLARFGLVPAIAASLELVGFSILIALSTQLSEESAHAFQIVFSIHNITFAVALGLGSAAGVRVGNAMGEAIPQDAKRRTMIAAVLAAISTGIMALTLVVLGAPIVGLFPAAPEVHLLALAMLIIWAPFILFDGVQIVFVYALRSLGDQVAAGISSILAFFVITGGTGLWFMHLGWGTKGLALASGVGMLAAALLHGGRFWFVTRQFRSQK